MTNTFRIWHSEAVKVPTERGCGKVLLGGGM